MKILSIETSCDETGISILQLNSDDSITLVANALSSQIDLHAQYGGVFPAMAKRAHAQKFAPLLKEALSEARLLFELSTTFDQAQADNLSFLTEKESKLKDDLINFFQNFSRPDIDYIAVTVGPGLEPALWVGINAARALSLIWNIPVIPINHMEGHIVTAIFERRNQNTFFLKDINFPILSLLVSGGHTELVISNKLGDYMKIGQTRDDAVGEAFDKVARMIGLPYPGGPAVSKLAAEFRKKKNEEKIVNPFIFPRPMLHSRDYDFSFSGIKTAVLYAIRDLGRELNEEDKIAIAAEFEDAVVEVLVKKTLKAIEEYNIQTLVVGGGVAGNVYLKNALSEAIYEKFTHVTKLFPEPCLATDNAVMIGLSAVTQIINRQIKTSAPNELKADGNLSL